MALSIGDYFIPTEKFQVDYALELCKEYNVSIYNDTGLLAWPGKLSGAMHFSYGIMEFSSDKEACINNSSGVIKLTFTEFCKKIIDEETQA